MQLGLTERFLRDFQDLAGPQATKCRTLLGELFRADAASLRQSANSGWRLHCLRGSNMVSLSVDMNYRVLAQFEGSTLLLHRVVKHDTADRPAVNRNDQRDAVADVAHTELRPQDVYPALRSLGVSAAEAEAFQTCMSEDDLLDSATKSPHAVADLALTLYETSSLVIPRARFRLLQRDKELEQVLERGGGDWRLYLHPSQAFLVEMPNSARSAVVGAAGTGKTVCAWHRARHVVEQGNTIGFVCPNPSILNISRRRLSQLAGPGTEESYFLVPRTPDELVQLAGSVNHLIVDETQEIPVTWLATLAENILDNVGITLFYDLNQLGGNIENNDRRRYIRRIAEWKTMLGRFPRLQRFTLSINFRNPREVAEHYLEVLSHALPSPPTADVPVFETGEVIQRKVRRSDLGDVLISLLRRLMNEHAPTDIAVVTLDRGPHSVFSLLKSRNLPVTDDPLGDGIVVTSARRIRGHERQTIILTLGVSRSIDRNIGSAIDAYIAMSRANLRLILLEVA